MAVFKSLLLRCAAVFPLALMMSACGLVDSGGSQGEPPGFAGADQTVNEQASVALSASNADAQTFRWTQDKNGAPLVTLINAATARASFVAPSVTQRTVLSFTLATIDKFGADDSDQVKITINNGPTANAGPDKSVTTGAQATLDAGASSDSDGRVVAYSWRQIDGAQTNLTDANTATPTFTAPGGQAGEVLTFRVTVTDNNGARSTDDVRIRVNFPPVANAGRDNTASGGQIVRLNGTGSSDPEGGALTFQWTQTAGLVRVSLNGANGPTPTFIAPNVTRPIQLAFQVTVTDNLGASDSDTVFITVVPANTPPVAANDGPFTVNQGGILPVPSPGVLRNDTDANGDPLTAALVSRPRNGSVSLSPNGSFAYRHNGSETTSDSFVYLANDGTANSNLATVSIILRPVNNPPVAIPDSATTNADTPVIINLTANDSDPDGTINPASVLATQPANGTVVNNANGTVTYTPDAGFRGADTFIYSVADTAGARSTAATVTVTVAASSGAPVASPDAATTNADTPVTINLTANDSDPGGTIDPASVQPTQPVNGTVSNSLNGTVTYTPNTGFSGADSFLYTVADNTGARSTAATVTVTVTAAAGSAPVANPDTATTDTSTPVTINVVANDTDSDGTINPATVVITTPPTGGSAVSNGNGTVTYTPAVNSSLFSGFDSFQYTVQDDGGATSNAAGVIITITGVTPVAPTSCWTTSSAQTLTANLKKHFDGLKKPLSYSLVKEGIKGTATLLDPATGAFVYMPNGVDSHGSDTFVYRVKDSAGKSRLGKVTVVTDPRVMPLGDSITAGVMNGANQLPVPEARVGYRRALQQKLTAAGYQMDFVGSQTYGAGVPGFDYQSEAHAGRTAQEMATGSPTKDIDYPHSGVYAWLNQNPADFVLLHVGSENLPAAGVDAVGHLLDEIDRWERDHKTQVRVLLARVVNHNPPDPRIAAFNDQVEAMVKDRMKNSAGDASPDRITMVDQQATLSSPADMSDRLHPNAAGYTKMANAWFKAIESTCRPPANAPLK